MGNGEGESDLDHRRRPLDFLDELRNETRYAGGVTHPYAVSDSVLSYPNRRKFKML
jgi:hypothetical protein